MTLKNLRHPVNNYGLDLFNLQEGTSNKRITLDRVKVLLPFKQIIQFICSFEVIKFIIKSTKSKRYYSQNFYLYDLTNVGKTRFTKIRLYIPKRIFIAIPSLPKRFEGGHSIMSRQLPKMQRSHVDKISKEVA